MFIDTRTLDENHVIDRTVCVIGAGVAGHVLAFELEKLGIDACVMESGGYEPEEATMDLNRGFNVGLPYQFADGTRSRYLGGSSNCWGGWNRPGDDIEFAKRDWVPYSGWPLTRDELMPYYDRTHDILQLGPQDWDLASWEASINKSTVKRMPLGSGRIEDRLFQFSPPTRFNSEYRHRLEKFKHVSVYMYANAVDIETDSDARTVSRIKIKTLSGRTVWVKAKQFILAAGGIENNRLLLASNTVRPNGLGNDHDVVGRFYLEHPRLLSASVKFRGDWAQNMLYDCRFHSLNPSVKTRGTCFGAYFALSDETQRRERVLSSQTWFHAMFPGEGTEASKALMRIKLRATGGEQAGFTLGGDILKAASSPLDSLGFAMTRVFHITKWIREVKLQSIVEPEPDPDSRITLAPATDALGMPRTQIDWRLGPQTRRTFDRAWGILAEELKLAGVADITLDPTIEDKEWPPYEHGARHHFMHGNVMVAQQDSGWPRHPEWSWHHMGGTRMSDDPKEGVIDRDMRVHGMTNLYVTGSSVFPTAAANFPTMTIAALTLRLSEHLAAQLGRPQAEVGEARARVAA